ncbi:hypothetical protein EDB19DRAFT_1781450 [Suillus lakei]|nr:hypothetical protein EDB19DRAFT_1781450 [Suillus lakei]
MRFSSILAVVAALTVSISAMPSVGDALISARDIKKSCPTFCVKSSSCGKGCGSCRCRDPFFAASVAAALSTNSGFNTSAVWLMTTRSDVEIFGV